jgi:hypothetical protein
MATKKRRSHSICRIEWHAKIFEMQDSDLKTLLGKMHCYLIEVAMKVRSRSDWARSSSNPVEDRHHYTE